MLIDLYDEIEGFRVADLMPMPKHLLVRWLHKEETKGGVAIPQNRQRMGLMKGVVLRQGSSLNRWIEGETILFDGMADKEFLGRQDPADRDSCFFMREEDVFAVIDPVVGSKNRLTMMNGFVMIRPDKEAEEVSGIVRTNREQKGTAFRGTVIYADMTSSDLEPGDRVIYNKPQATEVKLGDFEGELVHCLPSRAVMAVAEQLHG